MKRIHVRRLASLALTAGLFVGLSGALAAPASAASTKPKKFHATATVTTHSINPDGSFTVQLSGTGPKGASSTLTLSGVTTQGPKKVTKTNLTQTNIPVGTSGTANGFTTDVSAPWLTATLSGTVSSPTGYDPPALLPKITWKCVCDWSGESWSWTITIDWLASPTA